VPTPEREMTQAEAPRPAFTARCALLALATVTYFLPWHAVRPIDGEPLASVPEPFCTGFTHFRETLAMPLIFAGLAAFVALDRSRSSAEASIPPTLGRFGLIATLIFLVLQEGRAAHAFNRIAGERLSARIFYMALAALLLLELATLARALVAVLGRPSDAPRH
jgi:hypothetical protein